MTENKLQRNSEGIEVGNYQLVPMGSGPASSPRKILLSELRLAHLLHTQNARIEENVQINLEIANPKLETRRESRDRESAGKWK
ncbi:hypothetical protein EV2_015924 [Malus domestica]